MPELPEVETVVRSLAPHLTGRTILEASFSSKLVVRQDFGELSGHLRGQQIHSVRRHGKFILFDLDQGSLAIHLGMTGKLLLDAAGSRHARAVFELDGGSLTYDDPRQFGRIEWDAGVPVRVAALGPDALAISVEEFVEALRARRGRVKAVLLDQRFIRGLGNIYVDEALHAARIHPRAVAARIGGERARRLHAAFVRILRLAIEHKGSSISDYVDAGGNRGSFQLMHQVYGREGEPCGNCGTPVRRIVLAQRGTHYCPRCQRV